MRVEFLDKFNKDLDKITVKHVKQAIEKTIVRVESAKSISDVPQSKKLLLKLSSCTKGSYEKLGGAICPQVFCPGESKNQNIFSG